MRQIICADTSPEWRQERRKRITASELSVFMGTAPSFYSDTADILIARKLDDVDKEFDEKSMRRVLHGREREASAISIISRLLGFPVVPFKYFVSNDKWPNLGATLDALLIPEMSIKAELGLTSNQGQALEVLEALRGLRGPVLLETKVTDSGHRYKEKNGSNAGLRAWIDYMPDYHMAQVQAGMHIAEIEHAVLGGALGGDDAAAWHVQRDDSYLAFLDAAQAEAQSALGGLW